MTGDGRLRWASIVVAAVLATGAAGCSGSSPGPSTAASSTDGVSSSGSDSPTPTPAPVARHPRKGACYVLTYDQALAPTTHRRSVPCSHPHTATTYLTGELDTVVDGHLLAVDARRVQAQVAGVCPRRLPAYLHATPEQMRLTSLRAVWFSPTLAQADRGQNWFRCDVIALARDGQLSRQSGRLDGILATADGRRRFGLCGTTQPGEPSFARVICSAPHAWRAISSYDVKGTDYPGSAAIQAVAQVRCKADAKAEAADPLDFQWGYDWPTRKQWRTGQDYGLCWAPDAG